MSARWRVLGVFVGALVIPASSSATPLQLPDLDTRCDLEGVEVLVDGRPAAVTQVRAGDRVEVRFEVPRGCANRLTLASFVAPHPSFDGSRLDDQVAFQRSTGVFTEGRHSMAVSVYPFFELDPADCAATRAQYEAARAALVEEVRERAQADPEVLRRLRTEMATRPTTVVGPVDVSCHAAAQGRPCDGCVGNADDKEPPGQTPDGSDPNAGYECDRNPGIGDGNPAHEGCPNFQLDLAYRPAVQPPTDLAMHPSGLVFGLFCVRTAGECYVTDNTEQGHVAAAVDNGGGSPPFGRP